MSKPTKGPWIAAPDPEQNDCMAVVTADKHETIAFVEPSIEAEEIANARLLAAAPELLAALRQTDSVGHGRRNSERDSGRRAPSSGRAQRTRGHRMEIVGLRIAFSGNGDQ